MKWSDNAYYLEDIKFSKNNLMHTYMMSGLA